MHIKKIFLLLILFSFILTNCSVSSFTYKAAKELDLNNIQFYLKLRGDKIGVIGGPVYHRITKSTDRKEFKEVSEGSGKYTQTKTRIVQEDAIRIPLGTPGILHKKRGKKKLYIDFGEDVILLFESFSRDDDSHYSLKTRKLEIDGKVYDYDAGGGGWFLSNYVLDADIDMDLIEEEIEQTNEREVQGKTLKSKKK